MNSTPFIIMHITLIRTKVSRKQMDTTNKLLKFKFELIGAKYKPLKVNYKKFVKKIVLEKGVCYTLRLIAKWLETLTQQQLCSQGDHKFCNTVFASKIFDIKKYFEHFKRNTKYSE